MSVLKWTIWLLYLFYGNLWESMLCGGTSLETGYVFLMNPSCLNQFICNLNRVGSDNAGIWKHDESGSCCFYVSDMLPFTHEHVRTCMSGWIIITLNLLQKKRIETKQCIISFLVYLPKWLTRNVCLIIIWPFLFFVNKYNWEKLWTESPPSSTASYQILWFISLWQPSFRKIFCCFFIISPC